MRISESKRHETIWSKEMKVKGMKVKVANFILFFKQIYQCHSKVQCPLFAVLYVIQSSTIVTTIFN